MNRFQTINTDQTIEHLFLGIIYTNCYAKTNERSERSENRSFFYKESARRRDNPAYIQSLSTSAKQTRLHSAQTYELTIRRWTGYPD